MTMDAKDLVLLALGFALGIPASMVAALILGPAATILCGFHAAKLLARAQRRMRPDAVFDAAWSQTWLVTSDTFQPINSSGLRLHRFLHIVAGEADMQTVAGRQISFRLLAVLDASSRCITGKWMDPNEGGYYGAFQVILTPTRECAEGLWVGFSSKGMVKSGSWVWRLCPELQDGQVPSAALDGASNIAPGSK
jgi:hypothetical protein